MRASLRARYDALAPREQRTVLLGGVALALIFLFAILLPLERRVAAARERLERQQADVAWLQSVAPQLAQLAALPRAQGAGESLVVMVDRIARERNISGQLSGSQGAGDGAITVRFQQVPFDSLAAWAASLVQRTGATIVSASFEGAGSAGLVNASFQLRGP